MTLSEDRRKDIRKLQSQLVDSTRNADYLTALTAAEDLIKVTDAEGLMWLMPEMYGHSGRHLSRHEGLHQRPAVWQIGARGLAEV